MLEMNQINCVRMIRMYTLISLNMFQMKLPRLFHVFHASIPFKISLELLISLDPIMVCWLTLSKGAFIFKLSSTFFINNITRSLLQKATKHDSLHIHCIHFYKIKSNMRRTFTLRGHCFSSCIFKAIKFKKLLLDKVQRKLLILLSAWEFSEFFSSTQLNLLFIFLRKQSFLLYSNLFAIKIERYNKLWNILGKIQESMNRNIASFMYWTFTEAVK